MVELASYGLMGLTAALVTAFCLAYSDALPATQEKSSHHLINNAHMNDSPITETAARGRRFRGEADKRQGTAPAFRLRKTSPVETVCNESRNHSFRNDRRTLEVFHG